MRTLGALVLCWTCAAGVVRAAEPQAAYRPDLETPEEVKDIQIEDKPGSVLPLNLTFENQRGETVKLSDYFDGTKPMVLVLAYYRCPMLCTLVLNGLTAGLKGLAFTAGKEINVLTVSIDPRDTAEIALEKRENHLKEYGRDVEGNGWDFLVSHDGNVRQLANAVGFGYRLDANTNQYAHAAGAFIITPTGTLSRTLYGVTFESKDLRLALAEASLGKLASTLDRLLLLCFHYDPNARGYVLGATKLMRWGGALTLLVLGLVLLRLWRREMGGTVARSEHTL